MDMTPFIELGLLMVGIFSLSTVASTIKHHQNSEDLKDQTKMGIQAMIALATVSMTGSMAEEAVETHATPTPKELLSSKPSP
jgi:hypothetical protein